MTDLDRLNPGILRPQGIRRASRGAGLGLIWWAPAALVFAALILAPFLSR